MRPLCRCCAKPIKKRTRSHTFGHAKAERLSWCTQHTERPTTREEVQRLTNHQVVSIRKHNGFVYSASTWDGESYMDRFFCTDTCGRAFGAMAAEHFPDLQTQTCADAVRKQSA